MLMNMPQTPVQDNFYDEHGNTLKPAIIQDYNQHMEYVDKSDCMTNTYSISRHTWKWTKKLFFHLLDLTVLNIYILLISCGTKMTHRDYRLSMIRDLIEGGGRVLGSQITPRECQPFPPAGCRLDAVCTDQTEGLHGSVVCVQQTRSIKGQQSYA
jgi:hypothetical protein